MNTSFKHFIFRHYLVMAVLLLLSVTAGTILFWQRIDGIEVLIGVYGATITAIFIVQRQQHEELRTFNELFKEFNSRYDAVNERLNALVEKDVSQALDDGEIDLLNDYFNLCGEEYLYYRRGFIFHEVWMAWANGIIYFLGHPRIWPRWNSEEASASYYGLSIKALEKAVGRKAQEYDYAGRKASA